jgi:class 3 adenylate cyclase
LVADLLKSVFGPFVGSKTLAEAVSSKDAAARGERELICCVTNLFEFDSLCLGADTAEFERVMDAYYAQVADAVLGSGGDLDRFAGATTFSFYGELQPLDDKAGLVGAIVAGLGTAKASLESSFGVRVGVGLCAGSVLYGRFGSRERATITAFGPAVICARRLAESGSAISVCEHLMDGLDLRKIAGDGFVNVVAHCGSA